MAQIGYGQMRRQICEMRRIMDQTKDPILLQTTDQEKTDGTPSYNDIWSWPWDSHSLWKLLQLFCTPAVLDRWFASLNSTFCSMTSTTSLIIFGIVTKVVFHYAPRPGRCSLHKASRMSTISLAMARSKWQHFVQWVLLEVSFLPCMCFQVRDLLITQYNG